MKDDEADQSGSAVIVGISVAVNQSSRFSTSLNQNLIKLSQSSLKQRTDPKLIGLRGGGCCLRQVCVRYEAFGLALGDVSSVEDWGSGGGNQEAENAAAGGMSFSSDNDDSDAEYVVSPQSDIDLPAINKSTDDALTVSAYRLAMLGHQRKKHREETPLVY